MEETIKTFLHDGIAEVELNRLEKKNALNMDLFNSIRNAIQELEIDADVKLIIIRGPYGQFFSAGIDLEEVGKLFSTPDHDKIDEVTRAMQEVYNIIEDCPVPTICLIEGFAFGAAVELALACDFIIASDDTHIGLIETSIGLIPDLGGTSRLIQKVGLAKAKRIIYFAQRMRAEELCNLGVLDWVFPKHSFKDDVDQLLLQMSKNSQEAIRMAKKLISSIYQKNRDKNLELEREAQFELINKGVPQKIISKLLSK